MAAQLHEAPKSYWQAILFEVTHRHDPSCRFYYIPHDEDDAENDPVFDQTNVSAKRTTRPAIKVPLGAAYPNVYFTTQEARCASFALKLKKVRDIANAMQLSHRTVEYYLVRAREKMGATNKRDLCEKIRLSDFSVNYDQILCEDC